MSFISSLATEPFAIGLATSAATLAGGALALRLGGERRGLIGFGCGAVLGVALADLLPEAMALGRGAWPTQSLVALAAAGFAAYLLVDRVIARLDRGAGGLAAHIAPASLVAHSLMDGLAIGTAFAASAPAGLVVAAGVVAHDLMDGANTVSLTLAKRLGKRTARRWLLADAAAPLFGLALSLVARPAPAQAAPLLATFAGLFLYIGAGGLFSRLRSGQLGQAGAWAAMLGAAAIALAVRLAEG